MHSACILALLLVYSIYNFNFFLTFLSFLSVSCQEEDGILVKLPDPW